MVLDTSSKLNNAEKLEIIEQAEPGQFHRRISQPIV